MHQQDMEVIKLLIQKLSDLLEDRNCQITVMEGLDEATFHEATVDTNSSRFEQLYNKTRQLEEINKVTSRTGLKLKIGC